MRLASLLLALLSLLVLSGTSGTHLPFGAEANPTGSPIGGGPGYRDLVEPRRPVDTADELIRALRRAGPGDVVYVDDRAAINLTGRTPVEVPAGVTLASGRGRRGAPGALLFTTDHYAQPMILAAGDDVRVTGLRLRGPETRRLHDEMGEVLARTGRIRGETAARGVMSRRDRLEVDNCELWGWSHAAIFVYGWGDGAHGARIHHNDIHHNQRRGLGYGVALRDASALIEANRFDWNRHSIAGTGDPGTSYEARYNEVGPHASSHAFDMHGGRDRGDGTSIAGTRIYVHHNTFRAVDVQGVVIRGRPQEEARVEHNWFLHTAPEARPRPVWQRHAEGRLVVGLNAYGPSRRVL